MKKSVAILCLFLAAVLSIPLMGCEEKVEFNPTSMTMEEHADLIYERVEDYYIGSGYYYYKDYKDFDAFPMYNQNDELTHFVVEFEPYGFVYVKINYKAQSDSELYIIDAMEQSNRPWQRYTVDDSKEVESIYYDADKIYETNENGLVNRYNSHYKEAGIEGERRYLINIKLQDDIHGIYNSIYNIPAVKRGDKWLNLISMEEFALSDDLTKQACFELRFLSAFLK